MLCFFKCLATTLHFHRAALELMDQHSVEIRMKEGWIVPILFHVPASTCRTASKG